MPVKFGDQAVAEAAAEAFGELRGEGQILFTELFVGIDGGDGLRAEYLNLHREFRGGRANPFHSERKTAGSPYAKTRVIDVGTQGW